MGGNGRDVWVEKKIVRMTDDDGVQRIEETLPIPEINVWMLQLKRLFLLLDCSTSS